MGNSMGEVMLTYTLFFLGGIVFTVVVIVVLGIFFCSRWSKKEGNSGDNYAGTELMRLVVILALLMYVSNIYLSNTLLLYSL
jgi:hypothetical protein